MCGGTHCCGGSVAAALGLSPRVRGNPFSGRRVNEDVRSIPACAGEPSRKRKSLCPAAVYPRVCGGTAGLTTERELDAGLSPRVRGNPGDEQRGVFRRRSIPACAGEPRSESWHCPAYQVYPRVCGGTVAVQWRKATGKGLSPRVRGNRNAVRPHQRGLGSIPACAGEPPKSPTTAANSPVYPRVCGGTAAAWSIKAASGGLSPRVRGNHGQKSTCGMEQGAIPACAGEPLPAHAHRRGDRGYPRVCGGTCDAQRPA